MMIKIHPHPNGFINLFHLEKKTFFARDNGKKKSSGNAQAHLPDSGSISWNIYQILSWNDGLNFWKVLVRSVVFYNITVCYEWIITVGFSHFQLPSCICIFSHPFVFICSLSIFRFSFIKFILVKPSTWMMCEGVRGFADPPIQKKKNIRNVSSNHDANNRL